MQDNAKNQEVLQDMMKKLAEQPAEKVIEREPSLLSSRPRQAFPLSSLLFEVELALLVFGWRTSLLSFPSTFLDCAIIALGIVSETMTAMLPGMQQMLPQQASTNDELVQKLINQNEKLMQDNAKNQEVLQDFVSFFSYSSLLFVKFSSAFIHLFLAIIIIAKLANANPINTEGTNL